MEMAEEKKSLMPLLTPGHNLIEFIFWNMQFLNL